MNSRACRLVCRMGWVGLLLAPLVWAADLATTFTEASRYESGGDVQPLRQIEAWVAASLADPGLRTQVEGELARLIGADATFEAKRFCCQQLAIVGREASVPALAALLQNPDTIGIACLALANNPSPEAGRVLRERLRQLVPNGPPHALAQVINTLATRRDTAALSALARLARSQDSVVMLAAIRALGQIGDSRAQANLATLRKSANPAIAAAAAKASLVVAEQFAVKGRPSRAVPLCEELLNSTWPVLVRRGAFEMLLRLDPAKAETRIQAVLQGTDPWLKPSAIAGVRDLKSPDASRRFGAFLDQLEPSEQVLLLQSLAERNDPGARAVIQEQLRAANKPVRLAAIAALGPVGDASAVPALARVVAGTTDPEELRAVERTLSQLAGGDPVDRALMAQVMNRMAGSKLPILAALVRRANPIALGLFLAEAGSSDPARARLAFQGLNRVAKPEDLPAILNALAALKADTAREPATAAVAQTLARLGDVPKHSELVRQAIAQSTDPVARGTLLGLLVVCPDAPALATVQSALADADPAVESAAARVLADWPDAAAWDLLLGVYQRANRESDRVVALRGLARLLGELNAKPDAQLIGRYRNLLPTLTSDSDRRLVLGALAGCAHPDALALAVEQLGAAGPRAEAEMAVKKIAEAIKAQHPQAAQAALDKLSAK